MIYYYQMDPPLCSGGPPPRTRFALPATRERHLSMPEIGEKERDYLFTKLYRLSDLMSSLKILKSFRIPINAQSFLLPSAQSRVPYLRKRSRSL